MPKAVRFVFASAATLVLTLMTPAVARPTSHRTEPTVEYHLVRSVALGAPDVWDYVVYDPSSHRVFVAHGNRLTVVDDRSGRVAGHVGPLPGGPHGIAFDPGAGVGITDDGKLGQAVIFNLKTLRVVERLKIQRGADAVAFDSVSSHAFVIDGRRGEIAVIDPVHRRVVTFIHVGGDLEYPAIDDNGQLYVNGVTRHEIFRINTVTNRVDAAWPMPTCRDPHGLAIDTVTHRLFSSCENGRLVVVNADDGAVVATVPIGKGTDTAQFDPRRRLVFSSSGIDGTLSVIREVNANTFVPVVTVKTALSGRTMGIDAASGRVYVAAARTTSRRLSMFYAAWSASDKKPRRSPFTPDSLRLLFFDRVW